MGSGEIGDVRAVETLIESLREDCSEDVRVVVVWALGKIGDIRAVELLTQALKDESEEIRKAAKWALKRIKKRKNPKK